MRPVPAGRRIHEQHNLQFGVLGGWFRERRGGRAVLVTAAHLLTPDSIRFAALRPPSAVWGRGRDASDASAVEQVAFEAVLADVESGLPIARVAARSRARDICVAAALDERLATPEVDGIDFRPRPGQAIAGHEVLLVSAVLRRGRILDAEDLRIESLDGGPMGQPGDSGAPIVDMAEGTVVGFHRAALRDPRIGRGVPVLEVMERFGLTTL